MIFVLSVDAVLTFFVDIFALDLYMHAPWYDFPKVTSILFLIRDQRFHKVDWVNIGRTSKNPRSKHF
jgi:hypothetical protein